MTMTLETANLIWDACYGEGDCSEGWATYTSAQRNEAIRVRSGEVFYDAEAERIDRRRAQRDGWKTAHWDGRW
jgi:hypothetical protein